MIDIVENIEFDTIKGEFIEMIKQSIPEYEPLESDKFMAVIEACSYREMILRSRINECVKALLLDSSSGNNLDSLVLTNYGITRLEGRFPQADMEFALSEAKSYDVVIPKGSTLGDGENISILLESATIKKGELQASCRAELQIKTKESEIKTEMLLSPLPFVLQAKQLSSFSGGSSDESDESLRKRAILSLARFSTAGSRESYVYHTLSADSRITEAVAISPTGGVVEVYIKAKTLDINILKSVEIALNKETIRPLTDSVSAHFAISKSVKIKATIELLDLREQGEIDREIRENLASDSPLGKDLNLSYLYKILHCDGVYRVSICEPLSDIKASEIEYITIETLELEFAEAKL